MASVSPSHEQGLISYYNRLIDDLERSKKEEIDQNKDHHSEELDRVKRQYQEDLLGREQKTEELFQNSREAQEKSRAQEREKYQDELHKIRSEIYDKKGRVAGVSHEEHNYELKSLAQALDQQRKQSDQLLDNAREEQSRNIQAVVREKNNEITQTIANNGKQMSEKDDQIKDLNSYNKKLDHEHAKRLGNLNQEFRQTQKAETSRLTDTYQRNLDSLETSLDEKEEYYSRLNREIIRENERQAAELLRESNLEHRQEINDVRDTFGTEMGRIEAQRKSDLQRHEESQEKQLRQAYEERDRALENQAVQFRGSMDRSQEADDEKIKSLERQLQNHRTSSDTSLVSPAAEAAVRNAVIREYEKSLGQEIERNKASTDSIDRKYRDQYEQTLFEMETKTTAIHQDNLLERAQEKNQYLNTVSETEYQANSKLREQENAHERETQNLQKQYSSIMERQRREYEHIIGAIKFESDSRFNAYRAEQENNSRMALRENKARQVELTREYEKKIADQKRDFDNQLDQVRMEATIEKREIQKLNEKELQNQARSFEFRIAQLEAQEKERARSIAQSYEDELEKTRHSYELAAQKKS